MKKGCWVFHVPAHPCKLAMPFLDGRNSRRRVHSRPSNLLHIPTVSHPGLRKTPTTCSLGSVGHSLSMALMAPRHGVGACLSGCRIRSLSTVCSRIGLSAVEAPLGGMARDSASDYGGSARYSRADGALSYEAVDESTAGRLRSRVVVSGTFWLVTGRVQIFPSQGTVVRGSPPLSLRWLRINCRSGSLMATSRARCTNHG